MAQKQKLKILVIHGPNLNLLGSREPGVYGATTLKDINAELKSLASKMAVEIVFFQSNHEGELIEHIQKNFNVNGILINPAAYTHTSVGLRDVLLAVKKPFVEVHLSNVHKREDFRQRSYFSDIALGVVTGFGPLSYTLGFKALAEHLKS
jgi:3-dehydroquinate dehydratase-2